METLVALINDLAKSQPWAMWIVAGLAGLGGLVVAASGVVAMTPSKKDDEWLAKFKAGEVTGLIWKFLRSFSVVKQKDNPDGPI